MTEDAAVKVVRMADRGHGGQHSYQPGGGGGASTRPSSPPPPPSPPPPQQK